MTHPYLITKSRAVTSSLVRWCKEAETWQPANEATCVWEHLNWNTTKNGHRLRLRRMLVCGTCEQAYFTKEEFETHECFSAY